MGKDRSFNVKNPGRIYEVKIGIDIRPLQNNNKYRGIGKLTESLILAISHIQAGHDYVFYVEEGRKTPTELTSLFNRHRVIPVKRSTLAKIKYVRALAKPYTKLSPSKKDIDVLLQTDPWNGIPKDIPTVAIFYDVIPLLFKTEDHLLLSGVAWIKHKISKVVAERYYFAMLRSYRNAAKILSISRSSRDDYLKYIEPTPLNELGIIPLGLIKSPNQKQPEFNVIERYGLKRNGYVLYVGGIDVRKNIMQLLRDLNQLIEHGNLVKLVLVGKEFERTQDLKKLGWFSYLEMHPRIKDYLVYTGYLDEEYVRHLYENALAFTFPSRYEGFGLPILEAMDADCPVICYRNSSIPEVAGNAAILLQDGSPMVKSIERLLVEKELRSKLTARGRKRVHEFTWDKAAATAMEALKKAHANRDI